jgi:hypothetical protein
MYRRTTVETTGFGGRKVTTTVTTGHDVVDVVDAFEALLRALKAGHKTDYRTKARYLSGVQRHTLAVEARRWARNKQVCALGSKDGSKGPRSAQNQTDMINGALEKAEEANFYDPSVVSDTHVWILRELACNVENANRSRHNPSTCFKHVAIG